MGTGVPVRAAGEMQEVLLHFGACRQGSRQAGSPMQAAVVASTLGRMRGCGQAQVSSLSLLLLCSPVKAPVVRKFMEISCSGLGRGGKMAGQQTRVGNVEGAGQAK